jgi:hypothetical protein
MVKAGRVPGMIIELTLNGGGPFTVFDVMSLAATEIGRKKGLTGPAFPVTRGEYFANGRNTVDVPQLNGRMLAEKVGERWTNVAWDTPVSEGDIVLVVPKIQGNQFTVSVSRIPGAADIVGIYGADDPEGGPDAGTVAAALKAAGITLAPGELVLVNGEEAELYSSLNPGDSVTVTRHKPAETETASAPEEVDFSGVSGTDPEELRKEGARLRKKAERLEAKAAEAPVLRKQAEAFEAKATAIELTLAALADARARLKELGLKRSK